MNWKEIHHLYLGFLIIIIGFIFQSLIVVGIGLLAMIDDWIQHFFKWEGRTPLHIAYAWIYKRSGLVRKINLWFDNLFKKKGLPK